MSPSLAVEPHPLLALGAFTARFPRPLGELATPPWLASLLVLEADAPLARDEALRQAVRDLLRHGGYKPTGRGKPSSEYLVRAAGAGALQPINAAVDCCNAVSLASGLPISVVDLGKAAPPLSVRVAPPETSYVFNPSGQEIRLDGLLALYDAAGPCANAVKDAQRTKTDGATRATLSLVWAPSSHAATLERAVAWYRELLERLGATTEPVAV